MRYNVHAILCAHCITETAMQRVLVHTTDRSPPAHTAVCAKSPEMLKISMLPSEVLGSVAADAARTPRLGLCAYAHSVTYNYAESLLAGQSQGATCSGGATCLS